ncbi:hypothetical protein K8R30_01740 [archaeon]|nr:hypothetical protein [archaeon]
MENYKLFGKSLDIPEAKKLLNALETIAGYYNDNPKMYTEKNWRYVKDMSDEAHKKSKGSESLMREYVGVMMKLRDGLSK